MFALNVRPVITKVFSPPGPPPCHKCKHYDSGSCKKFFAQEPVSGEIAYFDAYIARADIRLCGGKYFTSDLKRNWD